MDNTDNYQQQHQHQYQNQYQQNYQNNYDQKQTGYNPDFDQKLNNLKQDWKNFDWKKTAYNVEYQAKVYATALKKFANQQKFKDIYNNIGSSTKQNYYNNNQNNYNNSNSGNSYRGFQFKSFADKIKNNFSDYQNYRPKFYIKTLNWMRYNKVLAFKVTLSLIFMYGVGSAIPYAIGRYAIEKQRVQQITDNEEYQQFLKHKKEQERQNQMNNLYDMNNQNNTNNINNNNNVNGGNYSYLYEQAQNISQNLKKDLGPEYYDQQQQQQQQYDKEQFPYYSQNNNRYFKQQNQNDDTKSI